MDARFQMDGFDAKTGDFANIPHLVIKEKHGIERDVSLIQERIEMPQLAARVNLGKGKSVIDLK